MRKICTDYQLGRCTYGDRCKFFHPKSDHNKQHGGRSHPYLQPNKSKKFDRQSDPGPGPQRGDRMQSQHSGRTVMLPQSSSRATPLSPNDGGYPLPPAEDSAAQQQQQQPQQPQQRQQGIITPLDRARAMCKLLGVGNAAPLVTPEMQASALQFFTSGAFFRETPFADSIEKYLPQPKPQ